MTTPIALDNLPLFTLAAGHSSGDSTFALGTGGGAIITGQATKQGVTLGSAAPIYFLAVPASDFRDGCITSVANVAEFQATGISGDSLTGVSLLYPDTTTDPGYAAGDYLVFAALSQYVNGLGSSLASVSSEVSSLASSLSGLAPLESPGFTGVPTAPTAATGTNTTQVATTAFVLANASGAGDPLVITGTLTDDQILPLVTLASTSVGVVLAGGRIAHTNNGNLIAAIDLVVDDTRQNNGQINFSTATYGGSLNLVMSLDLTGLHLSKPLILPGGNHVLVAGSPQTSVAAVVLIGPYANTPGLVLSDNQSFPSDSFQTTDYLGNPTTACEFGGAWAFGARQFLGQVTITPGSNSTVGLAIQLVTTQTADAFQVFSSGGTLIHGADAVGALRIGTMADSAASVGRLYFGSDHLDGNSDPKLCRKGPSGNVTVIG